MNRTLLLDSNWDITLTAGGRLAVTDGAYAIAQNVANAIRLFTRDAYYDQNVGIPHFETTLGKQPSEAVVRSRYRKAAMGVLGVADAQVEINGIIDSVYTGNIKLTLKDGGSADVTF